MSISHIKYRYINTLKKILISIGPFLKISISRGFLENIDIHINKDILGKKSIFNREKSICSCFYDEISILNVDILAFFEISKLNLRISIL